MENEVTRALKMRRSIRSYGDKSVDDEVLKEILECGMYAPSGMGKQSGVMVVVKDEEVIRELSKMNAEVMNSDKDPFYGAKLLVVVLGDTKIRTYEDDGALIMGNLMNAAYSLGVGSCWINRAKEMFKTPRGKEYLNKWGLDDTYEGIAVCILGYASEEPTPKDRKDNYVIYD